MGVGDTSNPRTSPRPPVVVTPLPLKTGTIVQDGTLFHPAKNFVGLKSDGSGPSLRLGYPSTDPERINLLVLSSTGVYFATLIYTISLSF